MKRAVLLLVLLLVLAATAALPTSGADWSDGTDASGAVSVHQPIRVTTYEIGPGEFTGTNYSLTLNQPLAPDYFVMIRGSSGTGQERTVPSADSVRVIGDTHHLTPHTPSNQLALLRVTDTLMDGTTLSDWRGTVTVIESLNSHTTDGFVLKDVVEITLTSGTLTGTATSGASFVPERTVPYGGIRGGGVTTTVTTNAAWERAFRAQWARFWLSGTNTVNAEGSGILAGHSSTYTIFIVEWGTNWTIQHAHVSGRQTGDGIDNAGEYTTAPLTTPVARANSWVVAYGHTTSGAIGGGWQGQVFTLGNGVVQNATESQVAIGAERGGWRHADVYVHTHPRLSVTHIFGPDHSIGRHQATGAIAVPSALGPEAHSGGGVARTEGTRFGVFANSSNGRGRAFPRSIFWARHESDTTMVWERARTGQQGAFWSQSIDFGEIWR